MTSAPTMIPAGVMLALALLATACGDVGDSDAPHLDELPALAAVEEVRIGSLDDPDAGFSRIGTIRGAATGEIYVLESAAREVRVFSPDGERLRTIGRRGEGPGEFLSPSDLGLLGDTLWVYDFTARRITWFGPDGAVLHTTPAPRIPVESRQQGLSLEVGPRYPQPDGSIESGLSRMVLISQRRRIEPFTYPVVRFDRDGAVLDTLRWETEPEDAPTFRVADQEGYAPYLAPLRPLEQDLDDGSIVVDWSVPAGSAEGTLDVVRLGPDGDTIYQRQLRYDAIPVPSSVLDSLVEPRLGLAPMLGVSEGELTRALRGAIELPDHRPPVRLVHAGSDGTAWIQLNTPATDTADWVLIGADGAVLGRLTLPAGMRIRYSHLPSAWAVELDEVDVPWLVRLRVE
jgi:hypothetical protein